MTFTINDQILKQFNFIFEIYSQHTEKKHRLVSVKRDRPQLSLKSKTITNQQRIGCLVYPEITQTSERSLQHQDSLIMFVNSDFYLFTKVSQTSSFHTIKVFALFVCLCLIDI